MPTIFWDIETRSTVNLRDCGAHIYARDASTQVLCLVFAIDDEEPQLWLPSDPVPEIFLKIAASPNAFQLVAHNYEFERAILKHVLIPRHGFPPIPIEAQHCSQRLALANAYPAELDLLAQALGLPYRKDPEARKAMLAVSRPKQRKRKADTAPIWDNDPAKLQLVFERCKLDVIASRAVWQSPKLKQLSETERGYQIQDAIINKRGVRCDRAFVSAARDLALRERTTINSKLQELTQGAITTVHQSKRFLAAINARGHSMTTLNKRAVAQVLARKPEDFVRQLLELRRDGASAAVHKYKRMLAYASPADDRMRGTLRMYGTGTGRWAGLGPQLQNLKKNEGKLPLSVVDSVRAGDRAGIAQYGNPLALLGDVSRAALCAGPGMELISGDFSAIESVMLAWLAGETWKLEAFRAFKRTGDTALEPYRVTARKMMQLPADASVSNDERRLGKTADLASGFGGSVGAWRRFAHDSRQDEEIKAIIGQWRRAHPAVCKFWKDLACAVRITINTGRPVPVAPLPRPPIIATFADGNLTLTLPSGRVITYPGARLIPSKFEDAPPDVEYMDNARGQWKPYRGWFGTFVENVVSGTARDLFAAAIARFEARGLKVVFHCHDEITIEAPIGAISESAFREILLELPEWAAGLPLTGKVHSGAHYLAPPDPDEQAQPLDEETVVLEQAVDAYIDDHHDDHHDQTVDDQHEDDEDVIASLTDSDAPLPELVSLPLTSDNKVSCPFHDDPDPSCAIYADHFFCYGCGERGDRIDWLTRAEGMTTAEAAAFIKDWAPTDSAPLQPKPVRTEAEKLAFVKSIWVAAQPLLGSMAEDYLEQTRGIDVSKLPADIHRCLRFHPRCTFGPAARPCLIALMRDPITDAPLGIQRIALERRNGKVMKVERRMLGRSGAVKLWPAGPQLVIGEGLETVLAGATGFTYEDAPLAPAWALLSSEALRRFPTIPGVERLIILADHDETGALAAAACAARWTGAGRTVVELTPTPKGADFNDLIMPGMQAHG